MYELLKNMNYKFSKRQVIGCLRVRNHIVLQRRGCFRDIRRCREERKTVCYLDEIWVTVDHTSIRLSGLLMILF